MLARAVIAEQAAYNALQADDAPSQPCESPWPPSPPVPWRLALLGHCKLPGCVIRSSRMHLSGSGCSMCNAGGVGAVCAWDPCDSESACNGVSQQLGLAVVPNRDRAHQMCVCRGCRCRAARHGALLVPRGGLLRTCQGGRCGRVLRHQAGGRLGGGRRLITSQGAGCLDTDCTPAGR